MTIGRSNSGVERARVTVGGKVGLGGRAAHAELGGLLNGGELTWDELKKTANRGRPHVVILGARPSNGQNPGIME